MIAANLGAGLQTIKVYRIQLMEKLGVNSVPEWMRAAEQLGQRGFLEGKETMPDAPNTPKH